jgi:hypothetical protein
MDKSRSDATSGAETKYASGAHAFTHDFCGVRVAQSLIFYGTLTHDRGAR